MQLSQDLALALVEDHPVDTARILERYSPREAWAALLLLGEENQPDLIENMHPEFAARVLNLMPFEAAFKNIREMSSEASTDVLALLDEGLRQQVLNELPNLHSDEIKSLLQYPEDSVGSIMSPDFVALRDKASVADALRRLRRMAAVGHPVNYVYVIDQDHTLKGVLVMRDLVLAAQDVLLEDVMLKNIFFVCSGDDIEDAADILVENKLLALPVTNKNKQLIGVLPANQILRDAQQEGFEDAQKMFGAGEKEQSSSTVWYTIRQRLPWLQVNLVTAFAAAAVVAMFEGLIAKVTILAAFLPIVAGQSGNAGAQALAVTLRALAMNKIDPRRPRKVLLKELFVGFFNGLVTGTTAAAIALVVSRNLGLALVVCLSMTFSLLIAGISGALIPILMERLGQDPAQSSNIILTTVTDIIGFLSFLGLALIMMPMLGSLT